MIYESSFLLSHTYTTHKCLQIISVHLYSYIVYTCGKHRELRISTSDIQNPTTDGRPSLLFTLKLYAYIYSCKLLSCPLLLSLQLQLQHLLLLLFLLLQLLLYVTESKVCCFQLVVGRWLLEEAEAADNTQSEKKTQIPQKGSDSTNTMLCI